MTNISSTSISSTNHATGGEPAVPGCIAAPADAAVSDLNVFSNADSWRIEVAARLERYRRRRRPRTPHYPSLLLPFDAPESWSRPASPTGLAGTALAAVAATPARAEQDSTFNTQAEPTAGVVTGFAEPRQTQAPRPDRYPEQVPEPPAPEPSAKVIEFPRSAAIPVFRRSELADPVFDDNRPRIVEVPEILPPPPALGGMLMEPSPQEPADEQAGADSPLVSASASIARRTLAVLVDGVVLAAALAAFAAIFLRFNPSLKVSLNAGLNGGHGPLPMLVGPTFAAALAVAALLFWMSYEFLFVVFTGSTPGLRAARLRLTAFDGSPLNRRSRRWRVLASFLSAFSAGLGYLWCVLDQDGLCWHDRITRTHIQSESPAE
ncbi:MAG: RDD family protein [Terriglobales bacterium]